MPSIDVCSLASVLDDASALDRAFIADVDGHGTSLLMASSPARMFSHYGHGSASLHRSAGYVELEHAPVCLRRDVDDLTALQEAMELGVGEFTHASLYGAGGAAARMAGVTNLARS